MTSPRGSVVLGLSVIAVCLLSLVPARVVLHASGPASNTAHIYALDAGGGYDWKAGDNYAPDGKYINGTNYTTSDTISTGVYSDAPSQAVLQSQRTGQPRDPYHGFHYVFDGLAPLSTFTLTLWLAEVYWSGPGQRLFNIESMKDGVLEQNFDIYLNAGGKDKLLKKTYSVTSDANGNVDIWFYLAPGGVDNPCVQAIALS